MIDLLKGLIPIIVVFAGIIILAFVFIFIRFFGIWFRALLSGAPVGLLRLVGMSLRKVKPTIIVDSRIMLAKAGIDVKTDLLETHYLARGDVFKVCLALVAANKANIPLKILLL